MQTTLVNIILFLSGILLNIMHPVHVSVSNIEYRKDENKMIMSYKIFAKDLEASVKKTEKIVLGLKKEKPNKDVNKYLKKYIQNHIQFIADGDTINNENLKLNSWKTKDAAVWIYAEIPMPTIKNKLQMKNTIMTDFLTHQTNLVIFVSGKKEKGYTFNNHTTLLDLDF